MSTGNLRRADMKMEVVENDLQSRASSCNPVEKIDRFRIATLRHMSGFVPNYIYNKNPSSSRGPLDATSETEEGGARVSRERRRKGSR